MFYNLKLRSASTALLVVVLLVSIIMGILQFTQASAINTPWLSTSGRFIKDPSGNTVILRGVSLVDIGVANSGSRSAVQLTNMATDNANGWYARVVRFPVYPNAIDMTPGWIANPDAYFNNHLNPAIQNCVARQIYCIIDWHYISNYDTTAVDTATRNFWNYVAPKYANTPNVIFELYNEPINPDNWSTWKQRAQPWVDIIRSHAPNNLILIGGPRWSQNLSSAASSPFVGNNLVYVAHIYPQHGGQSTWDSWFGNAANSVPFFITEWGWQNGGAQPTSGTLSGYGIPFSNYLETKGLSWTAWVFDDNWQPVMFDSNWNLLGGENFMGQFTKDELAQHQNDNLPGGGGPVNTPTNTQGVPPTFTRTPTQGTGPTATRTRTPTAGPSATRTNTPNSPVNTATRTPTVVVGPSATTPPTGGGCSPVTSTISSIPFTFDGAGTFCWQASSLGGFINSWNTASVSVNGMNVTNIWVGAGSLPAKIGGFYYVSYNSSVAWGHFEARP